MFNTFIRTLEVNAICGPDCTLDMDLTLAL